MKPPDDQPPNRPFRRPSAHALRRAGSAPAESPGPLSRAPLSREARPTVLVVDDHEVNRLVLSRGLSREGYDVLTAAGGRAALALVKERPIHLVLLDVMMPEMSGLEVLSALRNSLGRADLPVIMVTSRDASEDVVQALGLGANDYVTKPVDLAVTLARVATQLSLKRAKDEVEELNRRLREAEERIDELATSADDAVDDAAGWAEAMAPKVAAAIGAEAIEICLRAEGPASPAAAAGADTIAAQDLRKAMGSGAPVQGSGYVIVPIRGLGIEPFGALVVHRPAEGWGGPDRRLVESFARQLGGSIEMHRLKQQLEEAASQRRLRQQDMLDRGEDLLRQCPLCRRCYGHEAATCEHDGAELDEPQCFPYRISGRYRLIQLRGEGGMGTVFQAFDERLDRPVAVKAIKAEHFHNPAARTRFDHEARVVARIDHPAVVKVYDSGELDDGTMYIVMEWLEGGDLADMLRRCGPGTPREVAALVRQVAGGLAAAHDVGLVHRDVKPENVFLVGATPGFRAKVVDFGVAKDVAGRAGLTQADALVGTPRFMAPEQLLQKPVDARSDLYSLGAVAYQAITGRRVTLAEDFAEIVVDVIHTMPPPVSSLLQDTPPAVDGALLAALAKSPDDRPRDVRAWAETVAQALETMPNTRLGWLTSSGELDLERCPPDDGVVVEPGPTRLER